ncbi:DUF459 domain-containing protein [Dickeya dadantii]|uniref:SGNH/GDSL hydrolase family protein n=1 Tax=Dickeya dadantii TaxID=204038 RepID=UPI001CF4773A|nr:SGNH family hydrolase [Dickeya dadantii]MCA7011788.1 DUF459 domain-containing protein [Dickeya dadantii]
MPISEYRTTLSHLLKSLLVLLGTISGLIWLNQQSINSYWELHFHEKSPWEGNTHTSWLLGERVMKAAISAKDTFVENLTLVVPSSQDSTQPIASDTEMLPSLLSVSSPASAAAATSQPAFPAELQPTVLQLQPSVLQPQPDNLVSMPVVPLTSPVVLKPGQEVLFIGDSMMEGVAPHVIKMLRDRYHLLGIDLSKRSTGLAYPSFFNWPLTLERELKKRQNIRVLVVFLGPNDPWDMPSGKGKAFLKFASPEWEDVYRKRIRNIINLAREKQIAVIWVSPPNMENKKLNNGMHYLDGLFQSEVTAANQILIQVNDIFGYRDSNFSPDVKQDKVKVRVRSGDGIHFSLIGQKMIAGHILDKLTMQSSENEASH